MNEHILIKNIYYMLSYAYKTLKSDGADKIAGEEFDTLHDLFAAILCIGVGSLLKRGLYRGYVTQTDQLAVLRGKIRITESINRRSLQNKRLVCEYDEFTEDTLHNRILKCAMRLLLRHGAVRDENRAALHKLALYFGSVTDILPESIRWDAIRYSQNNAHYQTLLGICRLLIEGLLQTSQSGKRKLTTWLNDDALSALYERFVRAYYQKWFPQLGANATEVKWDVPLETDTQYLPKMRTDITLKKASRTLIIDTKCYSRTMSARFDKLTYSSANLYQILAYVTNRVATTGEDVSGMLLYAKTDEDITPDGEYTILGRKIEVRTLDLNCDWNAITKQLDGIPYKYNLLLSKLPYAAL